MNYIKELNAFHTQIIFTPLSSSAVALWYALMHFNNISGWRKEFSVAASQLQSHSGLKATSFKRARQELITKGHIIVTSQGANRAAKYRMVSQQQSFEHIITDSEPIDNTRTITNTTDLQQTSTSSHTHPIQNDAKPAHNQTHTTDHKMDHTTDPLFKQDDTQNKQTHTTMPADQLDPQAVQFYKIHFGMPAPRTLSDIMTWITHTNDDLVTHAMALAHERGKTTWAYVKGILKAWSRKSIMTVAEAKREATAYSGKHQHQKLRSHYAASPIRKEVIPDWFREQQKQREVKMVAQASALPTEPHQTREELRRMLDEFN